MKRTTSAAVVLAVASLAGLQLSGGLVSSVRAAEESHAFFESLVRRPDHWKSYSLRETAHVSSMRLGGFAQGNPPQGVSYDPASDTDPNRQDGTKVVVPAFFQSGVLTQPVSATATTLTLEKAAKPIFPRNRVIKVDREVMTVAEWLSDTTVAVNRATHGTQAAPHAAGAVLMHATNSLRNQVRVPLATEDGHDYFFVWESYWTDSYMGAGRFNHKAFQFSSGGRDGDTIWLEPGASYGENRRYACYDPNVHVAAFHVRYYNRSGGNAKWSETDGNMLGPGADRSSDFCILPNTWVRFFLKLQQRANDYDIVDMWVADETRDAVQVVKNTPVSVRPSGDTPNSIAKFWVEFNSSNDDLFRLDGRDLVSYVRNFVALRDARNPESLLMRPVSGPRPLPGPAPPRNLRIIR